MTRSAHAERIMCLLVQTPGLNDDEIAQALAIELPKGYRFYLWNAEKGYENLGTWIESAAKVAGR